MIGAGAVFAGTAAAAIRGNTEFLPATLCLFFVIFAQLSANFYYRYFDEKNRCGNTIDLHISSRKRPENISILKECSMGMSLLAAMTGLAIVAMGGWWTILLGAFILAAGWISSGGSLPLLRTPYGIVCSFVLFGPVCVISTSMIQSMHEANEPLNWFDITPSLYMGIIIGLMAVNSTILYGYASYYRDLRNSKDSFVTACGRRVARIVFIANGVLYTAVTIGMCLSLDLRITSLEMIPTIMCLLIDIYIWHQMKSLPRHKTGRLIHLGNLNILIMGLLSFIIFEITGIPDDSQLTFFGI